MIHRHIFYFVKGKNLKGKNYVEVKSKRYKIHPNEDVNLKERKYAFTKKIWAQNQVINDTQIRRNQTVIKIEKN